MCLKCKFRKKIDRTEPFFISNDLSSRTDINLIPLYTLTTFPPLEKNKKIKNKFRIFRTWQFDKKKKKRLSRILTAIQRLLTHPNGSLQPENTRIPTRLNYSRPSRVLDKDGSLFFFFFVFLIQSNKSWLRVFN